MNGTLGDAIADTETPLPLVTRLDDADLEHGQRLRVVLSGGRGRASDAADDHADQDA